MASVNSSFASKAVLFVVCLVFCFPLLNLIQTSHAASDNNTKNKNESGLEWYQKSLLPTDTSKCTDSFKEAEVCLMDFWTNLGRPSAKCCEALKNIDKSCLPALMPLLNPFIGPFLESVCSFASGSGGSAFPFPPFLPFPFSGASSPPPQAA